MWLTEWEPCNFVTVTEQRKAEVKEPVMIIRNFVCWHPYENVFRVIILQWCWSNLLILKFLFVGVALLKQVSNYFYWIMLNCAWLINEYKCLYKYARGSASRKHNSIISAVKEYEIQDLSSCSKEAFFINMTTVDRENVVAKPMYRQNYYYMQPARAVHCWRTVLACCYAAP
jgi:hypothetical protein